MRRTAAALGAGLAILLSVACAEIAARAALRWTTGTWHLVPRSAIGEPITSAAARLPEPPDKVLHPFLGFVRDPAIPAPNASTPPVNASGFRRWPEEESRVDAYTVAIFGGSTAERFSYRARQTLLEPMARLQIAPGRQTRILNFAVGGFKQPQQLAALAYLLSNGEHPDVVLNLDGQNEVMLSMADNLSRGINPFYPRFWSGAVQDVPSAYQLQLMSEAAALRRSRSKLADSCSGRWLRHSAVCRLIAEARDARLARRQTEIAQRLEPSAPGQRGLGQLGPPYPARPPAETYAELAAHWARCSVLMARLCEANGIAYAHVLLPSQYVAGSKPMLPAEKSLVFHPTTGYGPFALAGYPYLIAEGKKLPGRGVAFRDLTQVFQSTTEQIYVDDCCHVNERGNAILGEAIARLLAETLATKR